MCVDVKNDFSVLDVDYQAAYNDHKSDTPYKDAVTENGAATQLDTDETL